MKITGELLKAERIKKDLKTQDVAYALKLNNRTIQAIESGDIENLPSKTFIRGFVKSYAEYLKLDSNAVLKQFQEEMGSTSPVPRVPPPQPENKKVDPAKVAEKAHREVEANLSPDTAPSLNRKNLFIFGLVALLIVAIAGVNSLISKYQKEASTEQSTAQTKPALPGNSISNEVQKTDSAENLSAQPASADAIAATSLTANASVPATTTSPTSATPAAGASTAVATTVAKEAPTYPALEPSKGKPIELLIEAKKDTVVEYAKGNTSNFQKITIKKNAFQILRSNVGLHLRAEDGSTISVTVNGVTKGLASPTAKPVQISY